MPFGSSDESVEVANSTSVDQSMNQELNEQLGTLFKQLLPSPSEVAKILKENNFNVTNDDTVVIDINQIIRDNVNLSAIDISIPSPINLTEILPPGTDLSFLDNLNFTLPNDTILGPLPVTPAEILKGEITVSLDILSAVLEALGPTEIDIPIKEAMEDIIDRFFNFQGVDVSLALNHNFTVIDGFEDTNGKFGNTLGNVAIVDCRYFQNVFMTSYGQLFRELAKVSQLMGLVLVEIDPQIQSTIKSMNFCDYAMTVNGMLEDQIPVYTGSKAEMM